MSHTRNCPICGFTYEPAISVCPQCAAEEERYYREQAAHAALLEAASQVFVDSSSPEVSTNTDSASFDFGGGDGFSGGGSGGDF